MSIKIHHKKPVPVHGLVREFSLEVHGKDFEKIAKEYAEKYKENVDHVEGENVETPVKPKKTRKPKV